RLDVLAAQHRAAAAATGVAPIVRDRRVENAALAGWPDRGNAIVGAESRAQLFFRDVTRIARDIVRRLEPDLSVVDHQNRLRGRPPDDDDGVAAGALAGHGKTAARERVVEAAGERT